MNKNNPIQVLLDEHEVIRSSEKIINALDHSWLENENKYAEKVVNLLRFFREYTDYFHHRKEEDVLFRELKNNSGFLLPEIISELEGHHQAFRETVAEIEIALQCRQWKNIQNLLTRYMNDLLDHIAVENDEIFIIAEAVFSKEELERMYFRFEDIDSNLGKDKKNELENENQ